MDPRVERTRAAVLGATRDLLVEIGVERTCIELVAERSGVARSTIYRHWDNKPQLVMDALEALRSPDAPAPVGDAESDLRALIRDFGAALRAPTSNILGDLQAAAGRDPELARVHRDFIRRKRARALGVIERLQDEGRLDPALDVSYLGEVASGPLVYRRFSLGDPMTEVEIDHHLDEVFHRFGP